MQDRYTEGLLLFTEENLTGLQMSTADFDRQWPGPIECRDTKGLPYFRVGPSGYATALTRDAAEWEKGRIRRSCALQRLRRLVWC